MHNLSIISNAFQYSEREIRTATGNDGEVWFCAKDVCAALDIQWSGRGNTLRSIPEDWVVVSYYETSFGVKETIFVSEPAVYKLIFRSSKPAAEAFARWVCSEVLPAIRKQGFFGTVSGSERAALSRQIISSTRRLVETKDAYERQALILDLRDAYNRLGRPMPDLALLGKDYRQLPLGV